MSDLVFNSGRYTNHTSTRVIDEVNRVKNKRLKIYPLILDFIQSGGQLNDASLIQYNIHLNENDKQHLKSLFSYLASQQNSLFFLRVFQRQYKNMLEDAINLVIIFTSVDQPYIRDLITGYGIHTEDAEIIVDAYYWSPSKTDPKYITIERRAIEANRDRVLHILRKQCTDFPETQLMLLNITELT
jgi:hypothetical protein